MPTPDWDITLTNTEKAEIYNLVAQEIRLLRTALDKEPVNSQAYGLKLFALNLSRELQKKDPSFNRQVFLADCGVEE